MQGTNRGRAAAIKLLGEGEDQAANCQPVADSGIRLRTDEEPN